MELIPLRAGPISRELYPDAGGYMGPKMPLDPERGPVGSEVWDGNGKTPRDDILDWLPKSVTSVSGLYALPKSSLPPV
jgi:hypothetical protein